MPMTESQDRRVWVAVRVQDGTGIVEYYGRLRAAELAGILAADGTPAQPGPQWFGLEVSYWLSPEGKFRRQSIAGKQFGYDDTVYFRTSNAVRIIPLTEDFVRESLNGNTDDDAPADDQGWYFWR